MEIEAFLDQTESDLAERKESFEGDAPQREDRPFVPSPTTSQITIRPESSLSAHGTAECLPMYLLPTDHLLQTLADIRSDGNIQPMPALTVEKRFLKGAEMAVVTVMPSDMPPVKYNGRIWIRTGPRRSTANAQEERILIEKRRYKNLPFDLGQGKAMGVRKVAVEGTIADGDVEAAGVVVEKCFEADGCVAGADGVKLERGASGGDVEAACGIAGEGIVAAGGVAGASGSGGHRSGADGGVVAGGAEAEDTGTDGDVLSADDVAKEVDDGGAVFQFYWDF